MRLIGYIDGVEVAFDFYSPNIYKAIIPKKLNGKYIIELKAIDGAGNENGLTNIYVYIDFQKMYFKILDENYRFNIDDGSIGFVQVNNTYRSLQLVDRYGFKEATYKYSYRELVI